MNTKEKILSIIEDKTGIDQNEISDSTRFIKDLGMDSLDLVELTMELESQFNITIDDNHIDGFKRFSDVVDYVENLTNNESE